MTTFWKVLSLVTLAIAVIAGVVGAGAVLANRKAAQALSTVDMSPYALKSDIPATPDLTGFAKKDEIPVIPDLSPYALKSDIPAFPDFSEYAKKSDLSFDVEVGGCPVVPTLQPLSPDLFLNGQGRVYGILAFGRAGCWYALEGQPLFEGWKDVHEIVIGWGAQELWPHRQGTIRIYPVEFDPLAEAKKLAEDKCKNVEEDEKLEFVPIVWKFHGKWEAQFTCADVAAGKYPEVPAEMLQPQDDVFPLCQGVPNGDPVCGEGAAVVAPQSTLMTSACVHEGNPVTKVVQVNYSEWKSADGCSRLFEGVATGTEGENPRPHEVYGFRPGPLPSFGPQEGSYWIFPANWEIGDIVADFISDKCAAFDENHPVWWGIFPAETTKTTCSAYK